jgi:hypothetical protein
LRNLMISVCVEDNAMQMHYSTSVFKAVRNSDWSAEHVAAHGVNLDGVREAILEQPYWAAPGRDGTTLVYGRTYAGRSGDMTEAEKKTFRRKAR